MDRAGTQFILGIETGGEHLSVGLVCLRPSGPTGDPGPEVLDGLTFAKPAQRTDSALSLVHELLDRHELEPSDLALIAVGRGPGSFTGIRLGLSLALGLSLGAEVPIWPVCSLASLALNAGHGLVLSLIDARKGEVYGALFRLDGGPPEVLLAPLVGTCEGVLAAAGALAQTHGGKGVKPVVLGSGAVVHGVETTKNPEEHVAQGRNTALLGAMCWLAAHRDSSSAPAVDAVYLRRPEAEIALDGADAPELG